MVDLSESINGFALQPLNTLNLHYHNAYGYQTWQEVTYNRRLPPIKSHDPLITRS